MNLHFKICLYNPYVIVHLKSLKRQICRYGGSNILGVYQNKSYFFQVCEHVLFYFGSVATHEHIASKSREKDQRGKALFANVERGVGIFLQNCHSFIPIR